MSEPRPSDTTDRSDHRQLDGSATRSTRNVAPHVRPLRPADAAEAVEVIARAFDTEPAHVALLSDPEARRVAIAMNAHQALLSAQRYATAYGVTAGSGLAAVALWIPPGGRKVSPGGVMQAMRTLAAGAASIAGQIPGIAGTLRTDISGAVELMRQRRPAVARASRGATWELTFIATSPEHQGSGFARALLERQLRRCDEDSTAVWLETTDPVNESIYHRFGFETVAHIDGPSWLPGFWVMRRDPPPG